MKILITNDAERELSQIYDYIANVLCNPQAAKRLLRKINSQIETLANFPFSGPAIQGEPYFSQGLRRLIVKNYVVIYQVREDLQEVYIRHIFYAKSNYLSHL